MGIWIYNQSGKVDLLQRTAFITEAELEGIIEENPELLFDGEPLLTVGRQVPTSHGRQLDLLLVDGSGRTVVVEFKKDRVPRDVVAQALEYAAFVSTLDYDSLNTVATRYFGARGDDSSDLVQAFVKTFGQSDEETTAPVWNADQRVVVAAVEMSEDIADVARYLRLKGLNVSAVEFDQWIGPAGEKLLECEVVVGMEPITGGQTRTLTEDEVLQRATPRSRPILQALLDGLTRLPLRKRTSGKTLSFDIRLSDGKYHWFFNVDPHQSDARRDTIYVFISKKALQLVGSDIESFNAALDDKQLLRADACVFLEDLASASRTVDVARAFLPEPGTAG